MLPKQYQDYLDNIMNKMDNARVHKCPECSESDWGITIEPSVFLVCNNCGHTYTDDLLNHMILPYLPKTQKEYDETLRNPLYQFLIICRVFRFFGKKEK